MLMGPNIFGVTTLRHDSSVRPDSSVGIKLMPTVRLVVCLALSTLQARVRLGAHTDSRSLLDERDLGANFHCSADDFYNFRKHLCNGLYLLLLVEPNTLVLIEEEGIRMSYLQPVLRSH
jgi:hypothetical protein